MEFALMECANPHCLCPHVAEGATTDVQVWFTGVGKELNWVCWTCAKNFPMAPETWVPATSKWLATNWGKIFWEGIVGKPGVKRRESGLGFVSRNIELEGPAGSFVDVRPCRSKPQCWYALSTLGMLVLFSSIDGKIITSCQLDEPGFDITAETGICIAPDNDFVVVSQTLGPKAVLASLLTGKIIKRLSRGDYQSRHSSFPAAFFCHEGKTYLIAASDWNRLDLYDPVSGQMLSERGPTTYKKGEQPPPHDLDYFHGGLSVSPDQQAVVDNGWCWSPVGLIRTWNLPAWLANPWESEDGPSARPLIWKDGWDEPICWSGNTTLVTWGWGKDEWTIPAAVLIDIQSGQKLRWFPGFPIVQPASGPPRTLVDSLFFDTYLFSVSNHDGTAVWDVETGECLATDPLVKPCRYHPDSKEFLEMTPTGFRVSTLVE